MLALCLRRTSPYAFQFLYLHLPVSPDHHFHLFWFEQVEIDPGVDPLAHFRFIGLLRLVESEICIPYRYKCFLQLHDRDLVNEEEESAKI